MSNEAGPASAKPMNRLIASNRVEGTSVYGRDGSKVGSVHSFMVDKLTGQVAYAVLSFGGFLGLGQKYHPLPWESLNYDVGREGYVGNVDKTLLEGSPSYRPDDAPVFSMMLMVSASQLITAAAEVPPGPDRPEFLY